MASSEAIEDSAHRAAESGRSGFDSFAAVYNRHWGPVAERDFLPVINRLLVPRLPRGARLLDVGCGTGQLAAALTRQGYDVVGIDTSVEMLSFARRNAPAARFVLADARAFTLPGQFDAAISTFDSLNHLMSQADLQSAFASVFTLLAAPGWFLFDLNMEQGYLDRWGDSFGYVEDDCACVVRTSYRPADRTGTFDVTVFHLGDEWHRTDVGLEQRCHELADVEAALAAVGFRDLSVLAAEDDLGLEGHYGRTFFLCRKPNEPGFTRA